MTQLRGTKAPGTPASILETILAGNYTSFRQQRTHLQRLDSKHGPPRADKNPVKNPVKNAPRHPSKTLPKIPSQNPADDDFW